jgi:hypothetical protein
VTNTEVQLGTRSLRVDCLVRDSQNTAVQINAIVPGDIRSGPTSILVKFSDTRSPAVPVTINTSDAPGRCWAIES